MLEPIIFVVSREEVENEDISSILGSLNSLLESPEKAKMYCEKIDIAFDGYNNTQEELFEIMEVRNFVYKLDAQFPYWLYFCSKELLGLKTLLYCFFPLHLTEEAKVKYYEEKALEILTQNWFLALNAICKFVKADENENIRLTEATYRYIFGDVEDTSVLDSELQHLRDKTFDYEDNQEHFVGSHFDAFFDDMREDVMMNIPAMMDNSTVVTSNYVGKEELAEDERWQKGHILTSPSENLNEGLGIIVGQQL